VNVRQRPPHGEWMAVSLSFPVPLFPQRDAMADHHGQSPDVVDDNNAKCGPDGLAQVVVRLQDTQVQQQNGDLGEEKAEVVEQRLDISRLWTSSVLVSVLSPVSRSKGQRKPT
jgi:hypothetical protein